MSSLTATTLAYVTYQDIRGVQSFEDRTIIAIKAPAETRLEVPDPKDVRFAEFLQMLLIDFANLNAVSIRHFSLIYICNTYTKCFLQTYNGSDAKKQAKGILFFQNL